jgi:hypothetical protein
VERATRYDAIIATLVGVLALLVSAYTAHIQRQQVRAQVYPIIQLNSGVSNEETHLVLANKGSGPALIRNVAFSIDGQPLHSWDDLISRVLAKDEHSSRTISFVGFGETVVAAGEQIRVLSFSCTRPSVPIGPPAVKSPAGSLHNYEPDDETCARLVALIRRLSLSICYCSTLDDCLVLSDGPDRERRTTETRRCPARSADSFN